MLYRCLRLTKTKLIVFALAVIAFVVCTVILAGAKGTKNARNDNDRTEFINSLGIKVEKGFFKKQVIIPNDFNKTYLKYNELQKTAGFDLLPYAGRQVTLYTYYKQNDNTVKVNILVYGGKIIGGDICSTELSGSMAPLCREKLKSIGT